ncbi:MAG: Arc family DNA-binding protein [Rubrivivax sp.]
MAAEFAIKRTGRHAVAPSDQTPGLGQWLPPTLLGLGFLGVALTFSQNGTIMVPQQLELTMTTTITLKGIPDDVYQQLKLSAEVNRRSLNSEAIACLETMLLPRKATALEHIAKAREIRAVLQRGAFKPEDIDRAKREGRA